MKVLVDINVLVDVFEERQPFVLDSADVWAAVEEGRVVGVVSAVTCTTFYYLVRRLRGRDRACGALREVAAIFELAAVDGAVIKEALTSGMVDFEDAVQAYCGHAAGASHIITRDTTGFVGGPIPALSPDEFLSLLAP